MTNAILSQKKKTAMKARLAKICSLLPFVVYGVLVIMYNIYRHLISLGERGALFSAMEMFLIFGGFFGWIPSLISSLLGILMFLRSLMSSERGSKICLILSCVNAVISALWGWLALVLIFC